MTSRTSPRAVVCALVALGVAFGLTACNGTTGGSLNASGQTKTAGPLTASSATPSPLSSASSPPSATPTASPTASRCRSGGLQLAYLGWQGAAGNIAYSFEMMNVSSATCTLYGYPGFAMESAQGAREPVVEHRTASPAPTTVVLAPGQSAAVDILAGEQVTASFPCHTAATVVLTPPNAYHSLDIRGVALQACGPSNPVAVEVFPVTAGSTSGG